MSSNFLPVRRATTKATTKSHNDKDATATKTTTAKTTTKAKLVLTCAILFNVFSVATARHGNDSFSLVSRRPS